MKEEEKIYKVDPEKENLEFLMQHNEAQRYISYNLTNPPEKSIPVSRVLALIEELEKADRDLIEMYNSHFQSGYENGKHMVINKLKDLIR